MGSAGTQEGTPGIGEQKGISAPGSSNRKINQQHMGSGGSASSHSEGGASTDAHGPRQADAGTQKKCHSGWHTFFDQVGQSGGSGSSYSLHLQGPQLRALEESPQDSVRYPGPSKTC